MARERVSQENLNAPSEAELSAPAKGLIVQLDGGHIPTNDKDQHSFEALSGVIYHPGCLEEIDQHHRRLTDKSCVISAMDDDLQTIKTYIHHAALRQGLTEQTYVSALADGAS